MRDCESHNDGDLHYNLVSVHNEEENNFIKNLLMEQSWYREPNLEISDPRLPWIGLRKNRVSLWNDTDNVRWVDDSPFGYNKWAENEPRDEVSMQMVQNIFVVLYSRPIIRLLDLHSSLLNTLQFSAPGTLCPPLQRRRLE